MKTILEQNLLFWLAITQIEGIGAINARKLLHYFEQPENIFTASKKELQSIEGIGSHTAHKIYSFRNFERLEKEIQKMKISGIGYTTLYDDDYPRLLKHCNDAPLILFKRGTISLENKKIISIVGTRQITNQGIDFIEQLLEGLSNYQPVIVSGYAYGADICAHINALKNNLQTIAVLGHGLHTTYPKSHYKYNRDLEENGGFISEFLISDAINRENFIRRNRIVAGLSEATIVIESAIRGGSLITATFANDYSREVFAVPGRASDVFSEGCNHLIKTNQAHLLTHTNDIVYFLNWEAEQRSKRTIQKQLFIELTAEEQKIYTYLKDKPSEIFDMIAIENQIAIHQLPGILLDMELKGVIKALPGKRYQLI